mmetsp:Transcript_68206/g.137206  ORF Transcript_68206/g.137206 Transcript_68206/m.137206 type:complete len:105 (+) Transcript_68206:61-375(+)
MDQVFSQDKHILLLQWEVFRRRREAAPVDLAVIALLEYGDGASLCLIRISENFESTLLLRSLTRNRIPLCQLHCNDQNKNQEDCRCHVLKLPLRSTYRHRALLA